MVSKKIGIKKVSRGKYRGKVCGGPRKTLSRRLEEK